MRGPGTGRLTAALSSLLALLPGALGAGEPPVVLSEIHYHPPGDADAEEEFLELENRTGSEVDLHGWELRGGVRFRFDRASGPALIRAREFLLVARSPAGLARLTGAPLSSIAGPYGGKLSNFRDRIVLVDGSGREMESVEYSQDGDWPARADGLGSSLQRVSSDAPAGLPQNWSVGFDPSTGGGERVLLEEGAPVRWFESPDGSEPGFEGGVTWWRPDFDDRRNGWRSGRLPVAYRLRGLHPGFLRIAFEVPESSAGTSGALVPKLYLAWVDGVAAWLNGVEVARKETGAAVGWREKPGYQLVWKGADPRRFPGGKESPLLKAGRNVLAIRNQGSGASGANLFTSARLVLVKALSEADFTPGRASSVKARAAPPLARFLGRSPEEPRSIDAVRLRARVEGDRIERVDLHLDAGALDGNGREEAIPMRDDGKGPDAAGGDGIFTAEAPPAPDLTVVRFRIEARDAAGGRGRFPREGNPSSRSAYYVVDRPPPPNEDLLVYHMLWTGELECAKGAWRRGSTFIHRGTAHLDVGFKLRGETSCGRPKSGLRVAFNHGDLFRGQRKLNLLGCWEDRAMLREKLAWDLYRDTGQPACRADLALVHGSGNRFQGLYVSLEDPGESWLRRNGLDPDGALWKCRSMFRLEPAGRYDSFERISGVDDPRERAELAAFRRRLNTLEGMELIDFLLEQVDVDAFIDYHAVKCLTGDEDGYAKNWLLHHATGPGGPGKTVRRWSCHPWDLDLSFGQINLGDDTLYPAKHPLMGTRDHPRTTSGNWNGFIDAVFGTRAGGFFLPALYARVAALLEEEFAPEVLGPKIDRLDAATIAEASADLRLWPRWGLEPTDPQFHRDRLRSFIEERTIYLRRFLAAESAARPPAPRVRITAVHRRTPDGEIESIEIRNLEKKPVDLSGWSIPAAGYQFPPGSEAPPDSVFIVARDPTRLSGTRPAFPRARVFGPCPGGPSGPGEEIRLRDAGLQGGMACHPRTIDLVPRRGK